MIWECSAILQPRQEDGGELSWLTFQISVISLIEIRLRGEL